MHESDPLSLIIGKSSAIRAVKDLIRMIADVDFNVLISGESGTGKELVARGLHYCSHRSESPFMKVNCAALPRELVESELFGHEKGSFTGAVRRKLGKFELAGEGTILLDEISEIAPTVQAKLLQVLQDQRFQRVGGCEDIKTSARVIAATNRDLEAEIDRGAFREDLYYRLNTIGIVLPPLRERTEDIDFLIEHFLQAQSMNNNISLKYPAALRQLFHEYHWPGNVRELENYAKRFAVLGNPMRIHEELCGKIDRNKARLTLPGGDPQHPHEKLSTPDLLGISNPLPSLKEVKDKAVYQAEKAAIEKALIQTNWNRKKACQILQISYRSLLYKLKEMDIKPNYS